MSCLVDPAIDIGMGWKVSLVGNLFSSTKKYTYYSGRFSCTLNLSIFILFSSQNVCIRRADGYCCIQYQLCADQTNPFTLDRIAAYAAPTAGLVDSSCTGDFVAIPGEKLVCQILFFPFFFVLAIF